MKKTFLLFCLIMISASFVQAQKNSSTNFNKVGETTVDFKTTKGTITLPGSDAYKALRIKTDTPVHIESLSVVYQDGSPETIPVRYDFKPGVESRDITLQGSKHNVKEVDFIYRQVVKSTAGKATVEVWGSK